MNKEEILNNITNKVSDFDINAMKNNIKDEFKRSFENMRVQQDKRAAESIAACSIKKDQYEFKENININDLKVGDVFSFKDKLYRVEFKNIHSHENSIGGVNIDIRNLSVVPLGEFFRLYEIDLNSPFIPDTVNLMKIKGLSYSVPSLKELNDMYHDKEYNSIPFSVLPFGSVFRTSCPKKYKTKNYECKKVKLTKTPAFGPKIYCLAFNRFDNTVYFLESSIETDNGFIEDILNGEVFYLNGAEYIKVYGDIEDNDFNFDYALDIKTYRLVSFKKNLEVYI